MAETLLQSQLNEIDLLPALPNEWSEGSVKRLRARGGYTLDIEWKDGKLDQCTVFSASGRIPVVRVNGQIIDLKADKRIKFN